MGDTYPLVPNRISSFGTEFKTTIVKFEKGAEQRTANWDEGKKNWTLSHEMLSVAEKDILEAFHESKRGAYQKFYFVNHHDGQTYEVRFKEDKLKFDPINAFFFNLIVDLVTC